MTGKIWRSAEKGHLHVEEVEADAVEALPHDVGGERGGFTAGRILTVIARQAEDHGLEGFFGRRFGRGAGLRRRAAAAHLLRAVVRHL